MLSIGVLNRDHLDASSPRNVLLAGAQYTARSAAGKSRPLTAGQNSRLISASEYRRHFICDRARLRSPRPIVVAGAPPPTPAALAPTHCSGGAPRRNPSVAHSKEEAGTSSVMSIAAVPVAIFESTGSIIIRTVSVPVITVSRIAPAIGVLNH